MTDGSRGCAGRGAVLPGPALLAGKEPARAALARARRPGREGAVLAAVAGDALRGRVRRADLAPRVRRAGVGRADAGDLRPGVRSGRGAGAAQYHRGGLRRPDHRPLRVAGPETALPAADSHRRGDLVPALLRARLRVRPRLAAYEGHEGRGRLADPGPEDLDQPCPGRGPRDPAGAHGLP